MARLVGLTVVLVGAVLVGRWFVAGSPEAGAAAPSPAIAVTEIERSATASSATAQADTDGAAEAKEADEADETETAEGAPERLAFTVPTPTPILFRELSVARWASGIYRVGESTDPAVAAADRDVKPRVDVMAADERHNGDVFAGYSGSQQGEIVPGLYSTDFDSTDCGYELRHVARRSRAVELIGEEYLESGRLLVTINGIEPDWFVADHACGDWFAWQPRPEPAAPAPTGDYWFGDLTPGRWFVPEGCLWEQTVAFRGALLRDVVASGQGPDIIDISDEPLGLRLRNCRSPISFLDGIDS